MGKIKTYHKLLKTFATNGKLELSLLLTVQVREAAVAICRAPRQWRHEQSKTSLAHATETLYHPQPLARYTCLPHVKPVT